MPGWSRSSRRWSGTCLLCRSNPDAAPFTKVGDPDLGQRARWSCLVEAMKVFNEIKSDKVSARSCSVLVTSGEAVEFGQRLFCGQGLKKVTDCDGVTE
jgi:hypothetical protein